MTTDELRALLSVPGALGPDGVAVPAGVSISFDSVTEDSRKVHPGTLFFAVSGGARDGHEFAAAARAAGAVAVAGERHGLNSLESIPYLHVSHSRKALGIVAHRLARDPSSRMHVVGVTGTNGKSSTMAYIAHILRSAGQTCATIGTLGFSTGAAVREGSHTTPFGETLAALFAEAESDGCTSLVMEVSSHAVAQERIAGIRFEGAVFTNLTQDHLDFHENIEDYRASKLALFDRIPETGFSVVNLDDPSAQHFINASHGRVYTYGASGEIKAADASTTARGTKFLLKTPWGTKSTTTPLIGAHNVANMLAAVGVCGALGIPLDQIVAGLNSVQPVPGRFERIDAGQSFQVIVDYAHTDDGLRNVLSAARPLCSGRLICVFGCGGDRDKSKRPKMAMAVAEAADFAVITSDNPRTENPERILLDIEVGMQRAGKSKRDFYETILDRREAIRHALSIARPGDFVLIAGKGHEDYQILGTEKIHFDDREVARELLVERIRVRP